MILQHIRIIVGDARFEPGTSAPEVWCATNEPPILNKCPLWTLQLLNKCPMCTVHCKSCCFQSPPKGVTVPYTPLKTGGPPPVPNIPNLLQPTQVIKNTSPSQIPIFRFSNSKLHYQLKLLSILIYQPWSHDHLSLILIVYSTPLSKFIILIHYPISLSQSLIIQYVLLIPYTDTLS